ncbi:peptidase U32 family protein [Carboxydothermus hydrogenoformans]|uniref:Peptidase, U32 family n=1 Tax=Carboxydothermus hydrogenoformans (strain ATCC BAA-161 / DSM 6008 / Z-2901) TaxID=246194 RepID=Q3AEM8_CARHZ|nr:U32 family peptidase [Carboxydothermus hydrogenoformans]ABB13692.1 peptidase, U32 family [Carboxydothermus hydrogenoformans Z-2901]
MNYEILAPAGNLEKLIFAFVYGADAAYLAGPKYGLRARAGNFTWEELKKAREIARELNRKIYITINIFAHNKDLEELPDYLEYLNKIKPDGVIVADPGVFRLVKRYLPEIPIHISTQANTTNIEAVKFWEELGAKRIVLARELTLEEIAEIRQNTAMELEMFVHGAMCISYSGRCLLSSYLTGRDANLGDCAQVCRWPFHLYEEKAPGQFFPIEEDERGSYIFNSYDLSLIEDLPKLVEIGINSFKIEGRMKSVHYVATTARIYKEALTLALEGKTLSPEKQNELLKIRHRPYNKGFLYGKPQQGRVDEKNYTLEYEFVGIVWGFQDGLNYAEQRGKIEKGDYLEIFTPDGLTVRGIAQKLYDEEQREIPSTPHPQMRFYFAGFPPLPKYSLIRKVPRGVYNE